eukprot:4365498-Pyramimonas_sp.AAC.1
MESWPPRQRPNLAADAAKPLAASSPRGLSQESAGQWARPPLKQRSLPTEPGRVSLIRNLADPAFNRGLG